MNLLEVFIKYRSFVGIVGLMAMLFLAEPDAMSITTGFFFIVVGMFFRGWAAGYIDKDEELATDGPYELTRNPLYFGNFILGVGIAVACNNLYSYLIFLVYYLSFFPFLMMIEHKRLKKKFGEKYEVWADRSNSFFPKLKRVRKHTFNISYYMKNREYRVLYFSLFIVAILILKVLRIIKTN